jgi:hypothetical protein
MPINVDFIPFVCLRACLFHSLLELRFSHYRFGAILHYFKKTLFERFFSSLDKPSSSSAETQMPTQTSITVDTDAQRFLQMVISSFLSPYMQTHHITT